MSTLNLPIGTIILWEDDPTAIPTGWAIVPYVSDRLVVGAGGDYAPGDSGGSFVLTVPEHTHDVSGLASLQLGFHRRTSHQHDFQIVLGTTGATTGGLGGGDLSVFDAYDGGPHGHSVPWTSPGLPAIIPEFGVAEGEGGHDHDATGATSGPVVTPSGGIPNVPPITGKYFIRRVS